MLVPLVWAGASASAYFKEMGTVSEVSGPLSGVQGGVDMLALWGW